MTVALPHPLDPPVRADGLCAQCLEPRRPERSRRYGGMAAEVDPFCSTKCCREWHGCQLDTAPLYTVLHARVAR